MHIERLRLVGFKSFVETAELTVGPGLTGIVGPNGCGKSNLVDALRWVMGEGSAKRLRGGGMDDVIFAGSAGRPGRNIAEVVLSIDNSARAAPFAFNDRETIEVSRRIDRGGGSSYRINGREARARDVQLLFADAATGAHSGALVSQGRVGALISAKPTERRLLLDEAAGTSGLHTRRHEAELKLKAAEDNLLRLDDVLAMMTAQLEGLKKQARQAQRYRRLAEQIRRMEAQLLLARWAAATAEAERMTAELRAAERDVAAMTEQAGVAEREHTAAETALPELRSAEAAASGELQRLNQARSALEQELNRIASARAEAEQRLAQLGSDFDRENEHLADAEAALVRLADERKVLERDDGHDDTARAEAGARLAEAAADLASAETGLQQMTEATATGEARRGALERQKRELAERRGRVQMRLSESVRQRTTVTASLDPPKAIEAAARELAEAGNGAESRGAAAGAAAEVLHALQSAEAEAIERARQAEHALARLKAEADALASVLSAADGHTKSDTGRPLVLSSVEAPEGFEAATAALFGDELASPVLSGAEIGAGEGCGWIDLGMPQTSPGLPEGVQPLAAAVAGPPALARRLSQSGLVENLETGWRLQPQLRPGQSLVDRDGHLWRWDGFACMNAGASGTAQQLRQRNRLAVLRNECESAEETHAVLAQRANAARRRREEAAAVHRDALVALRQAEDRLAKARQTEAEMSRRNMAAQTRLAALADSITELEAELAELDRQVVEADRGLALLPDPGLARAGLEAARAQAGAARRRESEARAVLDRIAQEVETRRRRLGAVDGEETSWRKRRDSAAAQLARLDERRRALAAEIAEIAARPAAVAAESASLAENAAQAAAAHRAKADALAAGDARLRAANEAARRADQALATAREQRVRREVQRDGAVEAVARLRAEIADRLDTTPEAMGELAGDAEPISPADAAARLDRLVREREAIGPVNLVAETEAAEVEARIAELEGERADVTEAIARLRRGIGTLDQEGRKRLAEAFERLNTHFAELFTRLFGGGKAHLALVDSDDPLEAGLDIMASPPGKKLQSLSLLSGGEQALTAIALIFAVFLTNPAPICVLDEVDAPLDDANVDRFCRLVADIADTTGTRFLLITHHRITMARMDRLFGVTMPERGVSQLVSVDLARAAEMRQTA
jgi:chromosome segregation protein